MWALLLIGWGVILGLFITFRANCLHGKLSLFRLFVLYVSLATAAVNVRLRYFFLYSFIDFLHR